VENNIRILSFSHMGNLIWNHNPQFVALKKVHRNLYLNFNFGKRAFKRLWAFFTKGKELLNVFL
jgi:hypothetical protein